ncbi:MAG: hypothetical protein HYR64_08325 [Fimbriimonas ginsengisoli]|uniref:Pentapeptide MXKDX repeat protein n=1 Tax=Fimbriimonas ginsengisoli TaxID=1005039 RepID=A0A931PU67_FIMGI|nr:hypothetical protein [Fimbriimonas ginsengisoli]
MFRRLATILMLAAALAMGAYAQDGKAADKGKMAPPKMGKMGKAKAKHGHKHAKRHAKKHARHHHPMHKGKGKMKGMGKMPPAKGGDKMEGAEKDK